MRIFFRGNGRRQEFSGAVTFRFVKVDRGGEFEERRRLNKIRACGRHVTMAISHLILKENPRRQKYISSSVLCGKPRSKVNFSNWSERDSPSPPPPAKVFPPLFQIIPFTFSARVHQSCPPFCFPPKPPTNSFPPRKKKSTELPPHQSSPSPTFRICDWIIRFEVFQ